MVSSGPRKAGFGVGVGVGVGGAAIVGDCGRVDREPTTPVRVRNGDPGR